MFAHLFIKQSSQNLQTNLLGSQFLRWRRKPRWVPTAKSKQYRIPSHPKQSEEEKLELMRLHNQYRTQMRSLRAFFRQENLANKEKTTSDHLFISPEQAQRDFAIRMQLNDDWNVQIAAEREQRLAIARKQKEEYVRERLLLAEYRKEEAAEKAREAVLKQIELSKTFITRENLDAKIEEILSNPIDHNFCIDLDKNIHRESKQN